MGRYSGRQTWHAANAGLQLARRKFAAGDGAASAGGPITLAGYPILWGVNSGDRGGYVVRLTPGSAKFAPGVLALGNHDFGVVLGNTANGTLRIGQADARGVPVEIDLPDTSDGRDVAELVGKGYVGGMSFSMANGFEEFTESKGPDGVTVLTVSAFTCDEVTITAAPAFVDTTIAVADDTAARTDHAAAAPARVAASVKLLAARLNMWRRG